MAPLVAVLCNGAGNTFSRSVWQRGSVYLFSILMLLFFKRTLLFLLPLLLLVGMIAFADPFNYYRTKSFIPEEVKRNTSYKFDMTLWKLGEFIRCPLPNIILGDSRTDFLGTDKIEQITGEKWANLAYGGATMPEIIQTFWYATKHIS